MIDPCEAYAKAYRKAMLEVDAPVRPYLREGEYTLRGKQLLSTTPRPLQPNTRLIAETIWQLKPKSLAEYGSGCGVNLHNISLLLPRAKLFGYELCQSQIDVMHEVFPNLNATVWARDVTRPNFIPEVEVALCHIMLMHLGSQNAIVAALQNMLRVAGKQIVLLENWGASNFEANLRAAIQPETGWDKMYLYTRMSPELRREHILIASTVPLPYIPLLDYEAQLAAPVRDNWTKDGDAVFDRSWENV